MEIDTEEGFIRPFLSMFLPLLEPLHASLQLLSPYLKHIAHLHIS
jgi:hypothetical protein